MIRRLFNLENNFTIFKATVIVGSLALLSRLLGLVRDRLLAANFGAGDVLDVYYASFRLPDLVFNFLILGTLSVAFIPVFTSIFIKDQPRAFKIANTVLNLASLSMLLICAVLYFFAPQITKLVVPGFDIQKLNLTVKLTRLFLLSPIIFTVSNVFSSLLNAQKKFLIMSLAPTLYNIGIIVGILFFYPHWGLMGLGMGVILGALMHLSVQVPAVIKSGFSWKAIVDLQDGAIQKIAKLFIPRIFSFENSQVSLLLASIIGSFLASGSIAVINLANNLQAVPLGIFSLSAAVAAFPALSESYAKNDKTAFTNILSKTFIQVMVFIIPITVLMLLFRAYIVRLILGTGAFNWEDTILTFNTLGILSISLFAQSLTPLLSRSFYARHNTIIPVIINISSLIANIFLSFFLGKAYGVYGIAAAFSISNIINAILLFIVLHHSLSSDPQGNEVLHKFDIGLLYALSKIVLCSLTMGIVGYTGIYVFAPLVNTHTVLGILIQSGLAISLSILAFIAVGLLVKLHEARDIIKFLYKIFPRSLQKTNLDQ